MPKPQTKICTASNINPQRIEIRRRRLTLKWKTYTGLARYTYIVRALLVFELFDVFAKKINSKNEFPRSSLYVYKKIDFLFSNRRPID